MSDIVERKLRADLDAANEHHMPVMVVQTTYLSDIIGHMNRLRAELAEARDKALDEAAEAVCGYIHPAYGKLPGDPFATAAIRALKSPNPPIL